MPLDSRIVNQVYRSLYATYGPQHWWPGDSLFEMLVGAILTQNTAWSNVERAIGNMKSQGLLSLDAVVECSQERLAAAIRPAGYFNVKALRLKNFCRHVDDAGGIGAMKRWCTHRLRDRLLSVNGVGPETADSMLLYGFQRPVFVIDAYTRRIGTRLGLLEGDEAYEQIQEGFEGALDPDVQMYNDFHALLVCHAKEVCRGREPHCTGCCLKGSCMYGVDG